MQHNRRLKKAGIITKYVHDERQKINRKTLIGFHMPELKRELILWEEGISELKIKTECQNFQN